MTLKARIENGVVYSPYPEFSVPDISLYQSLKERLLKRGNKLALVSDTEEISHGELLKMFEKYAAGFQSHGVKQGDKVLVHLVNSIENFIISHAIILAGGVAVFSDPPSKKEEIVRRIEHAEARYAVTTSFYADLFVDLPKHYGIEQIFVVGQFPGLIPVSSFKKLSELSYREVHPPDPAKDLAALVYTSGTTGVPKCLGLTHRYYVTQFACVETGVLLQEEDVYLFWGTVSLSSVCRVTMIAVSRGCTVVVTPQNAEFVEVARLVDKYKVNVVGGIPSVLECVAKEMLQRGIRLNSVKEITVMSASLTEHAAKRITRAFNLTSFKNVYGSSEAAGPICVALRSATAYKTLGFPAPNTQLKIVDCKTGAALGAEECGEIWVKTPSRTVDYYKNPEATAKVFLPDGWMRTGDMGYYDSDGQFHFVERAMIVIKCMSLPVAPSELEEVLLSHERVSDAAVIGVPHREYGEAAKAFVVLKPSETSSGNVSQKDLQDFVAERVAEHQRLYGGVQFVDTIPRNVSGKIMRWKLQNRDCT